METKRYINERALSMADGKIARWLAKKEGGVHYTVVLSPEELIPFIEGEKFWDRGTYVKKIKYKHLSPSTDEVFKGNDFTKRGVAFSSRVDKKKVLGVLEEFKTLEDNTEEFGRESSLTFDLVADVYKKPIVKDYGTYMDTLIRLNGSNFADLTFLAGYTKSICRDIKSLELVLYGPGQSSNERKIAEALEKNGETFGVEKIK